ncbi:MAG: sigma-70 family RNA polymerase sigma factor [Mariniblastus sp.]
MKHNDESSSLHTQMSLIECAKTNEPQAWDEIFKLYTPLIKRWAGLQGVRDNHEIENVCQEVLTKMFNSLETFSKPNGKGSFRGWIRVITRNHIHTNNLGRSPVTIGGSDWHRTLNEVPINRRAVDSLLDSISDHQPQEKTYVFRKIMTWVESEFSPKKNLMFKGVVIDQRPAKDVAKDFDVTENVVYQNKSRILSRIRAVYEDLI